MDFFQFNANQSESSITNYGLLVQFYINQSETGVKNGAFFIKFDINPSESNIIFNEVMVYFFLL